MAERPRFMRDGVAWLVACCGECRFHGGEEDRQRVMQEFGDVRVLPDEGMCRRRSPVAGDFMMRWPWMRASEWCGEFEPGD